MKFFNNNGSELTIWTELNTKKMYVTQKFLQTLFLLILSKFVFFISFLTRQFLNSRYIISSVTTSKGAQVLFVKRGP